MRRATPADTRDRDELARRAAADPERERMRLIEANPRVTDEDRAALAAWRAAQLAAKEQRRSTVAREEA